MTVNLDDYVDVAERIRLFKEKYPDGSLQPLNHEEPFQLRQTPEGLFVVYVAAAYRTPDDQRPGIGVAWEPFPGRTPYTRNSELMNAETSAWGRAIVALGADTKRIASKEEVRNRSEEPAPEPISEQRISKQTVAAITQLVAQLGFEDKLGAALKRDYGIEGEDPIADLSLLTAAQGRGLIERLKAKVNE